MTGQEIAFARDAWFSSEEGLRCARGEAAEQYLRNRLELAFIAGVNAATKVETFPTRPIPLFQMEYEAIENALAYTKGNRTRAAALLEISVRTLQRKLKMYAQV